ncbi:MAG: hypothetical protein U0807_09670 [Candidatus Binatia bacterium]
MDLLFILRDALASSLTGGLLTAIEARKAGQAVGVVLTQEALAAAVRGTFAWPRELSGQALRLQLADRAKAAGLPLMGRGEGRQLDAKALIARAVEAGVTVWACPIWSTLLGLDGALPRGITAIDTAALLRELREAERVIGTL